MADYYVWSGAAGTGDGSSWANAYTSLSAALTGKTNADRLFVAHDHVGNYVAHTVLGFPAAAGIQIICVNRLGSVPPGSADVTTGALEKTTGDFQISFAGFGYLKGVEIQSGVGASGSAGGNIGFGSEPGCEIVFENCKLVVAGTSANVGIGLGGNGSAPRASRAILINSDIKFSSTAQHFSVNGGGCIDWRGGKLDPAGSIPTYLVALGWGGGTHLFSGVDLSAAGAGKALFNVGSGGANRIRLQNCKLGAGVAITTGSIAADGAARVDVDNCDSADSGMGGTVAARFERYRYQGSVVQETTIVRTSGAADPSSNGFSAKMASNANAKFIAPLEGEPIRFVWTGAVGSAVTATVEIVNDGVTLTDGEIWGEVEYLGTTGFPLASFADDAKADVLATAANQATSTATWTTTGLTSPVKQKLEVTFTPQEKGVYVFTPKLGKASQTVYVDPLVTVA